MIPSRWRRVGVLLLTVWLLADTSRFASCVPQPVHGPAATQISAGPGSDMVPAADRQCFGRSQVVDVIRPELCVTQELVLMAPLKQLRSPDISIRTSSRPPRF